MYFLTGLLLCFLLALLGVGGECINGCSSRGLCINNECICAEGLSGIDCSTSVPSDLPTLYECPSCYTLTVGPPQYYSGPSWRIPDGPIVSLNYKGTLSVFQGNGNAELVAEGTDIYDWVPAPLVTLDRGEEFDSCGAWIMRAFTMDSGKVVGFYHAETGCDYANNGQTRKSGAYSESMDGGKNFTKPEYPNNRLIDTSTPILPGLPTGEGDFSVVLRDEYFYLFFSNVEEYHTGVARAQRTSEGAPGSFKKFYNGDWEEPGVGGSSTGLDNIGGAQAYVHTPSQSFVALGNINPYWDRGIIMSTSDDAVNWTFFADPITTPDPTTNNDQVMYGSLMGAAGGYDLGNKFQYFYMWIPPGSSWTFRYQVVKDVTLTYVGKNSSDPSTKIALTTFRSSDTGETWQSTELAFSPYKPEGIVGYLMTRPYSHSFPVYDCFNFTTNDHFVGTASECFLSGSHIEVTRALGHMWAIRTPRSVSVYRCYVLHDMFLSTDPNCEGRASSQTIPFGYIMDGPPLSSSSTGMDVLLSKGSTWRYYNRSDVDFSWNQVHFDDSAWLSAPAPFGASYSPELIKTPFGTTNYFFRSHFTIPEGRTVEKLLVSVASDNYADVYLNGVLVDADPLSWHEAAYWNRRIYVDVSLLREGVNQISVVTFNMDDWAFFDLELSAKYNETASSPPIACEPSCANGQCVNGKCECDYGWTGPDCSNYLCSFTDTTRQVIIPQGSSFRYTPWQYVPSSPLGWFANNFDDSWWKLAPAPFGTSFYGFSATPVAGSRHLFRKKFLVEVPVGMAIESATVSIASDDTHRVYINGKFIGAPIYPYNPHTAQKWNDVLSVHGSIFINGVNVIAVEVW
eukprot:Phypoly_transcript_01879.p1 GENE.Phypoly_transcript_01879~~Phypoly_transcript_01879.p1  ORF type:complete len:850 (+),score=109.64 Phypoly_transcript_01879:146-2695(+)